MTLTTYHTPALLEVVSRLAAGRRSIVDLTAGGGGHLERFLEIAEAVLAVDRDPDAIDAVRKRIGPGVRWQTGAFGDPEVIAAVRRFRPDLVFMDLGVSSHQVDADHRGFSWRHGVELDMRMTAQGTGRTAAEVLNTTPADGLRRIFREYGDERRAQRLAVEVVRRRQRQPFREADDLVNAIRAVLGPRSGPPDFARLFQAVRIEVNDELAQLETALPAYLDGLAVGGDLAVITYHSGEDRIVKHAFREWARQCICPAGQPVCTCRGRALGERVTRRPIRPDQDEVTANPRARSAKLRVFRKGPT